MTTRALSEGRASSRALAFLILVAVLLGLAALAVAPHLAAERTAQAIERDTVRLSKLRLLAKRLGASGEESRRALAGDDHLKFLLAGETTGIAGAELQQLVLKRLVAHNGRASSIQLHAPKEDGALTRIAMTLVARLTLKGLRDLLVDLESGTPLLFVDELTVRALPPPPGGRTHSELDVAFRIVAYYSADRGARVRTRSGRGGQS